MTSKEAFETLKRYEAELSITKQTEVAYDLVISARYEISKLVERDTLKKVEIGISKNFKFPICPNCKTELNEYYKYANKFCKECGQRLDWRKKNDK